MTARHKRSVPAAMLNQRGNHRVWDATVRADPTTSSARGSGGSASGAFASDMEKGQLPEAALAVGESFAERNGRPRKLEPIAQPALLSEHHPAREARQPRLDVHPRGQFVPFEPGLRGGAPGEELGEQGLAARRSLPGDMPGRIARLIRPQAREVVGAE